MRLYYWLPWQFKKKKKSAITAKVNNAMAQIHFPKSILERQKQPSMTPIALAFWSYFIWLRHLVSCISCQIPLFTEPGRFRGTDVSVLLSTRAPADGNQFLTDDRFSARHRGLESCECAYACASRNPATQRQPSPRGRPEIIVHDPPGGEVGYKLLCLECVEFIWCCRINF